MKRKYIFFLIITPFLYLLFFGCGSNEPNLKETKTYRDYGFEFQYPSNWTVNYEDKYIHVNSPAFLEMGFSYILDYKNITHKQRLADLVHDEKGTRTSIKRIILNEMVEGVRIESETNDSDVIISTRTEYFVTGDKKYPIVIVIANSIRGWDKDFPGIELILKTLKELEPSNK